MSQIVRYWIEEREYIRQLPSADSEVMAGICWGEPWTLFTPAYWLSQYWMREFDHIDNSPYKARGTLAEEIVFCLLGGFGITAEQATAAFNHCKNAGLISSFETNSDVWSAALQQTLSVNGRLQHYRYPNQKARFLAAAMAYLKVHSLPECSGKALRDSLLKIKGIGPKTAGWVARNFLDTDDVAILDIHLIRAGQLCGLFHPEQKVERDYFSMESRYIEFCVKLEVRPAVLDCLIWDQMRTLGQAALDAVKQHPGAPNLLKNSSISRVKSTDQMSLFK